MCRHSRLLVFSSPTVYVIKKSGMKMHRFCWGLARSVLLSLQHREILQCCQFLQFKYVFEYSNICIKALRSFTLSSIVCVCFNIQLSRYYLSHWEDFAVLLFTISIYIDKQLGKFLKNGKILILCLGHYLNTYFWGKT